MRHSSNKTGAFNHKTHSWELCDIPYGDAYIRSWNSSKFAWASTKFTYVKVLEYIYNHDGCSKKEMLVGLGKVPKKVLTDQELYHMSYSGSSSAVFSQLLYIDVIDYDKHYKYHITEKGKEVLRKAYRNDGIKKVVK